MRKQKLRLEMEILRLMAESILVQEIERNGEKVSVFRDATGKFASTATKLNTPDNQEQLRKTINYAISEAGDLRNLNPQQRVLAVKAQLEKQGLPVDDVTEACQDYLANTRAIESVKASLERAEEKHPKVTQGINFVLDLYDSPEEAEAIARGIKNGFKETNEAIIAVDQGLYDTLGIMVSLLDTVEEEKKKGLEGDIKTALAILLTILMYIGIPNVAALIRGKDIMLILANIVGMKTLLKSIKKYVIENADNVLKIAPEKFGYLLGVTIKAKGKEEIREKILTKDIDDLAKELLALREEALNVLQT